jgi:hypothetical protein
MYHYSSDLNQADNLVQACFELARINKRSRRPVDTAAISKLADRYQTVAMGFLSATLNIDLPLIIRAIVYLTQAHGGPVEDDDTGWFRDKLSALLEIARPYALLDKEGLAFVGDMQDGIDKMLAK